MKARILVSILIFVFTILSFIFLPTIVPTKNATLTYAETYNVYAPIYMPIEQLREPVASIEVRPLEDFGKIYIKDDYIFVNELYKGVHVINNRDPSHPKLISFINIPGNVDIAI